MSTRWKIYQKLLKQCRPYTLPDRWQRWPASRRVHLPPADAEQVLQALLSGIIGPMTPAVCNSAIL
jgi:hypothetical protein